MSSSSSGADALARGALHEALGEELYLALTQRRTVAPLRSREPGLNIDDAYAISLGILARQGRRGKRWNRRLAVLVHGELVVSIPEFVTHFLQRLTQFAATLAPRLVEL